MEASHLLLEMVQKFGKSLAAVIFDFEGEFSILDKIQYVMHDGLHGIDRATHDRLFFSFFKSVQLPKMGPDENLGSTAAFNDHFDEVGLMTAYRIFFWAAEVNFRGHFADALSLIDTMLVKAKERAAVAKAGQTSPTSETTAE